MEATDFENYTERLRLSLETVPEVIGLVTLGSTADPIFRDRWSDHDFWIITKPGAQDVLVDDLSWLPDFQNIAITVQHGRHGRTVLFKNRHKVEFIVFDASEAGAGNVERYRILIDRDQVAAMMAAVHDETLRQVQTRPDALENLCETLWSACERYSRGELLSARQYVDEFAVNKLLRLIVGSEVDARNDALDPRRRLEVRSPNLAAELLALRNRPVPEAALNLLNIAERELKPKAPALAWEKVAMVQGWISEILTNKEGHSNHGK